MLNVYVCVCRVVGMCSSTCIPCTAFHMSARITCWYLMLVPLCTVLRLVSQTRANVPSLPYPLRSSLGYHGR